MEAKIKNLIENLQEKTLSKNAKWDRIGNSEQFVLFLDAAKISLDKLRTSNAGMVFQFSIINIKGDTIFNLSAVHKDTFEVTDYDILKEFHDIVKRQYFKVDETLDNILNEVKKEGEIGKENDDLPF